MKTHPILFSTEMVQAIIQGNKTQTRRVIKKQPDFEKHTHVKRAITLDGKNEEVFLYCSGNSSVVESVKCPYGQVGDVLWVREEHLLKFSDDKEWLLVQFRDGHMYTFRMKFLTPKLQARLLKRKTIGKWQRARFLPKELARIFLENIGIRVEQLQDISETDAKAEGVQERFNTLFQEVRYKDYLNLDSEWRSAKSSFESLWIYINGAESWNTNPWVWVVEFKRVDKPANFLQA